MTTSCVRGLVPLLTILFALVAPSRASATTWAVPGTGSNVCTVANPNCNTIAQAVTASSSGDAISIGAGSFPVASAIALTKTLTISGAGIGTTFVQPTAGAFSVRTNNIVFRDFTVQNGTTGIAFQSAASNNTQITRVQFSGQTSRGIDVSLAATFPVSNVAITDCQFAVPGIAIRTSSTAQVAGFAITGTSFNGGTYALYVANDNSTSRFSGLTVQNTTFTNVGSAANSYTIYAEELRDAVIEDSTFTGGRSGIGLLKFYATSGVAASNIVVRRNAFSGFTGNALDLEVYLGGATPGIGLESPITIQDNTLQKNVAISISSPAIFVRLPAELTNAAVNIQDNDITLSGTFGAATQAHGIQLRGNGPIVLTGNTIDGGNVGGSGTTPPSSGIVVQSQAASTGLPSGTFSNVMPATVSISASCNRIQGFRNGVSIWDSIANVYGGLQAGAAITLTSGVIGGNDVGVVTAAAPPTISAEGNYWGCPAGPTDPACDGVSGDVDADPFASTAPSCVGCTADAECDDGLFCTGSETCNAGACVAGAGDPCAGGPECENVCNEAADNCIVPAATVCRAAAGDCDVAETCSGLGGGCPVDVLLSGSTTCRASAGECDLAETCDGVSPACPADVKQTGGTSCTSDGNPCTLDQCNGVADGCDHPAGNAGAVCRGAAGACDLAESCDGVSAACPADVKSTAVCRASAGTCDVAESCDGVADACPADVKSTAICRASAGACDVAESCDGVADACPADAFAPPSTVCRPAAGGCDVAESCSGSSSSCPVDTGLPDGDADTVCDALDNCVVIANPDQANVDGDAFGDLCDPCSNIVPTVASKPKLVLSKIVPPTTDDKLNFTGTILDVPASPTVDPVANGLRILVSDSTGAIPIDITIPGGAYDTASKVGWKVNRSGTSWRYRNAGRAVPLVHGITNAQLKAFATSPGKYKFTVRGKNADYAVNTANLPLTGTLVIDVPYATTGQCGEAAFATVPTKPNCQVTGAGQNVRCR